MSDRAPAPLWAGGKGPADGLPPSSGHCVTRTALFDSSTIGWVTAHLVTLLEAVAAEAD